MATIKSFTDVNQSKKLAEILPLRSADMEYIFVKEGNVPVGKVPFVKDDSEVENSAFNFTYNRVPCWSLTALLSVLKYPSLTQNVENKWSIMDWVGAYPKSKYSFDNPIDACYEMILKLHELEML